MSKNTFKHTIEDCQALAKYYWGKCLSTEYTDDQSVMVWSCYRQHAFELTFKEIKLGKWCRECAYIERDPDLDLYPPGVR